MGVCDDLFLRKILAADLVGSGGRGDPDGDQRCDTQKRLCSVWGFDDKEEEI